ncbi:MAG TPA: hypothetical protein VK191_06210 [Symbiobacteriaceae bacterium]|nr:hypothetical protein [Symbiobacteriaceae bacterium]
MIAAWERDYIRLGFRIEKHFPGYVDAYSGPPELKTEVEAEGVTAPADLVRAAAALQDRLGALPLAADRQNYLAKQVHGVEFQCRKLAGERFSLIEEAQAFYDITPTVTPESRFEEGLRLLDDALPGDGALADRLAAYRSRRELPKEHAHRLGALAQQTLLEVRRRSAAIWSIPEDESVELKIVANKPWGGYNWYLGDCRSLVEINEDVPMNLHYLVEMVAHEAYPGHHLEKILKDATWYREHGHLDLTIFLYNTPQCVIAEGIATSAAGQIFAPGELDHFVQSQLYPQVGMTDDGVDGAQVQAGLDLLAHVDGNAAFLLLDEGRPADEVAAYIARYKQLPIERAQRSIGFMRSYGSYIFTYTYGKQLMAPLLQGTDRHQVFHKLLVDYVTPSDLVAWAASR